MTYTLTLASGAALPVNFNGTLEDFHNAIVSSLEATIDSDHIITGQVGGTTPSSPTDTPVWLDTSGSAAVWKYWTGSAYVPVEIRISGDGSSFGVTLVAPSGTPTADRTINLQDKDGTLALLSDVYTPRSPITLDATTPLIDWSLSNSFRDAINANRTYTISNSVSGQEVFVAVNNQTGGSTTRTITWPSSVNFPAGSHSTTIDDGKTSIYVLRNIGGNIYGEELANY